MNIRALDTLLKSAAHEPSHPPVLAEHFTQGVLSRLAAARHSQLAAQLAAQHAWERWILRGSIAAAAAAAVLLAIWLPAARDFRDARRAEVPTGDAIDLLHHLP